VVPAVLKASGVMDILDLSVYPFGNSYYATKTCGKGPYSSDERHCWYKHCVAAESPSSDCFQPASIVAQHGEVEKDINVIEACAVVLNPSWKAYWPFIECMEREYSKASLPSCAGDLGLDAEAISACANGPDGQAAEVKMAKATPDHPGVPYILVNGKALDDPQGLLQAICTAYTGDKPEGCSDAIPAGVKKSNSSVSIVV